MPLTGGPLAALQSELADCRRCARLVAWREQVAVEKRASFREEVYWGRPALAIGDPAARLVVLGLAPAAHGGNRTGRIFTGDRSGDWLFGALWRAGYANQPESVSAGDGLALTDCWVTAAVRCAPPANRPTPAERDTCTSHWLIPELELLVAKRVILCLGGFAWETALRVFDAPRPRPRFGHAVEHRLGAGPGAGLWLLGSYHVSQQNTFTGRLTEAMLDAVLGRARELTQGHG
ncbi:uracil-DNA glycosylase [Conexibacter sp. DBS9H8]|uniref:uracil-DNA glycosylase n=1 Tax=Conexibacter sp. DBS9H8 TaxID=2937801 RepID=UPI00200C20CA|nr:uracil-DNA glycosylase [Conexibacter sp. DBS9H8]